MTTKRVVSGRIEERGVDQRIGVEDLEDAGVAAPIDAHREVAVVEPHEHHRNAGEQLVAPLHQERQRRIVRRQDQIEVVVAVALADEAFEAILDAQDR